MDAITAVIVTSPVPSNPHTVLIDATIQSIRDRLGDCEIIVCCDGPTGDLRRERVDAYHLALQRLAWDAQHRWGRCLPIVFHGHHHQRRMFTHALGLVRTPLVLFAEHDCPLISTIPFDEIAEAIQSGAYDAIRLHHEAGILEPHRHLMLGDGPVHHNNTLPLWPTIQYSARPHLASTGWYRNVMSADWWEDYDGMIEDRLHSVVQAAYADHGMAGWQQFRLAVYHPADIEGQPPGIKRSEHLDGRGDDDKVIFLRP